MNKKRFSMKLLSWLMIACLSFSLYPLELNADQSVTLRETSPDVAQNNAKEELQDQLSLLRVEQILESAPFLQDSDSFIGDNEWQELEIDNILGHWQKYCKTKLDRWGMKKLLRCAPQGSKELIRLLVENDDYFNMLGDVLDEVTHAQDALFAYWNEENILHHSAKDLYYSMFSKLTPKVNNFLNSNTVALETTQALSLAKPVVTLLALLGIGGLVRGYMFSQFSGSKFDWKESLLNGVTALARLHNFTPKIYKSEFNYRFSTRLKVFNAFMNGTTGDFNLMTKSVVKRKLLKNYFKNNDKLKDSLASSMATAFWVSIVLWKDYSLVSTLRGSVRKIFTLHKTASSLQRDLVKIANMMRALGCVEEIKATAEDQDCFILHNIKKYLARDGISQELSKLFDLLSASTFKKPASFFYSRGRLLNTHRLFGQNKEELLPLLQNVALLGGCRAIAQMVREHKDSKVGYCFVTFSDQSGPCIKLKNAWIPLVKEEHVVTNDFCLGLHESLHAVFTGPNGGGKSTSMLTVAFNVLLSRLGITAADEAYISNFSKIRTSLRPEQKITEGLSSFMAEHKRVSDVKDDVHSCEGNILVLVDEPYKGTVESEAAYRVCEFCKDLADIENCMFLMATHLRKPIELAQDTGGIIANFQMGYIEEPSGGFKRTFKVLEGPAIWWFDDVEKRRRFVTWLCENEI
ncbi:hypothetical protein ACFLYA_00540 [Candidatus Dependentiae bacterium]